MRLWRSLAMAMVAAGAVAGCSAPTLPTTNDTTLPSGDSAGGSLTLLSAGSLDAWDPQRITRPADAALVARTTTRTLTAYGVPQGSSGAGPLVGDLATDTGRTDASLRVWSFTLRDGLTWQDGSALTCEDVKYGISRAFALDSIPGPKLAVAYLDIPKDEAGQSIYHGPYTEGQSQEAGRAAYDRAVSCNDQTITLRFNTPMGDVPDLMTQLAFAPAKQSKDQGSKGRFSVFASGPYRLSGPWVEGKGGTLVRNQAWSAESDPLRRALPDSIVIEEAVAVHAIAQRIVANGSDDGRTAVSWDPVPPVLRPEITGMQQMVSRTIADPDGLTDALLPVTTSKVFGTAAARQAFALATDPEAYAAALGSDAATPATSLLAPWLAAAPAKAPSTRPADAAARAKGLLAKAKLSAPVAIRVSYPHSDQLDAAMRALLPGWAAAGFSVSLQPLPEQTYGALASAPKADQSADVFWTTWSAGWDSGSAVLPPIFDGSANLTQAGAGSNYGRYSVAATDAAMAGARAIADPATREAAWAEIDASLRDDGAYVPLARSIALFVAGSKVRNLTVNAWLVGRPDLAVLGAE